MKALTNGEFSKAPKVITIAAFAFVSVTFFYLGKHWSDGNQQLVFFTTRQTPSVSLSPNLGRSFNISSLISANETEYFPVKTFSPAPVSSPPNPPPPPPPSIKTFGIVDENGTMSDEFEVGEFDQDEVLDNWAAENGTEIGENEGSDSGKIRVEKFQLCSSSMSEYIPCLDNVVAIKKLKSTEKGEWFELLKWGGGSCKGNINGGLDVPLRPFSISGDDSDHLPISPTLQGTLSTPLAAAIDYVSSKVSMSGDDADHLPILHVASLGHRSIPVGKKKKKEKVEE